MKYKIQLVNVFGEVVDESVRPLDAEEAMKLIRAYESLSKPAVEQSVHPTESPIRVLGSACPECGGCEWQCAECNGALGR